MSTQYTALSGQSVRAMERRWAPCQGTIGDKVRQYAQAQPDHPAMASPALAPLTYYELQRQIERVQVALRQAGLATDARIAIAVPDAPFAALAIVAVSCSAISVPLNPRQTRQEVHRCLTALRPSALLLMGGTDSAIREAAVSCGVPVIEAMQREEGILGFDLVMPQMRRLVPIEFTEPHADAPAFILPTSGTSSEPKLIPHSHSNMLAAAARHQAWYKLTPQDRCLSVTAPFYSHGVKVTIFTPLLTGGSVAFPADPTKFEYREWFTLLKPTWYSAGPAVHRLIFDRTASMAEAKSGHSLRFITGGGAPLPLNVLQGLQNTLGVPVLEHYASSEAGLTASNQVPPEPYRPGTCGIPWPGTLIVVDEDGNERPAGEQGEILVRGPTLFSEYLGAPELNRGSFLNGWFRTGDIGKIDADGFLAILGRKTEFINRGGEKIAPVEIDQALMRHPAVAEAAAFSLPHPRLGEDIGAAVTLRPGMKSSPLELRQYLQGQLAPFKVPRRVAIRDSLPKGATGKVLRQRLAESWQKETVPATEITSEIVDGKFLELAVQLTAIWERLLEVGPLNLDDDFFERGGDSLLAMEMLAELDKLTGTAVPESILFEASTIRQLARKLYERSELEPKYLVEINSGGHWPPLVFFHGHYIWGGAYLTVALTKLVGSSQPMLVVAPHADSKTIPNSIEAMAADRLPLILKAQPEGPYRLCGICLGGIVAFETARLLIAAGKEVEMVVMIDPPTINAARSVQLLHSAIRCARPLFGTVVDRVAAWTWHKFAGLQRARNVSWRRKWTAIGRRVGRVLGDRATDAAGVASNTDILPVGNFADPRNARYAAAMSNYNPKPLGVRVVYVAVDYTMGAWKRVSPEYEVVKLPGTHYQLDLPKLADVLRSHLHVE